MSEQIQDKFFKAFCSFLENFGGTQKEGSGVKMIKAFNEELMQSLEVVYEPFKLDAHKQWMSKETVSKLCKSLDEGYKEGSIPLNLFHMQDIDKEQAEMLKAYTLEEDSEIGGYFVPEGTCVALIQFKDEKLWKMRKEGTIGGLSVGGKSKVIKPQAEDSNAS